MISPWVLHRHARRWSRPDTFDPAASFATAAAAPSFMPFGAGPRVCVGAEFGLAEVVLVLAILIRKFEFQLTGWRPVIPAAIVSMQPDHPAPFRLRAR